jgi:hypothetical protein
MRAFIFSHQPHQDMHHATIPEQRLLKFSED